MQNEIKGKDWFDILAKLFAGLGALLAGILVPLVIHVNGERSRNNQLYAEIVSQRERADSELRAKMVENLINTFFSKSLLNENNRKKLSLLRLLALNFHEFFDLKPLFQDFQEDLSPEEKIQLREILDEVVGKQVAMLARSQEVAVFEKIIIAPGQANGIQLPPAGKEAYRGNRLGIVISEINQINNYVKMEVKIIPENTQEDLAIVKFKLSYSSMPFVDNTKLFNATRFAVTLDNILYNENDKNSLKRAEIKVIFFPETYMSSRDRPYLDEMLEKLHNSKEVQR